MQLRVLYGRSGEPRRNRTYDLWIFRRIPIVSRVTWQTAAGIQTQSASGVSLTIKQSIFFATRDLLADCPEPRPRSQQFPQRQAARSMVGRIPMEVRYSACR